MFNYENVGGDLIVGMRAASVQGMMQEPSESLLTPSLEPPITKLPEAF